MQAIGYESLYFKDLSLQDKRICKKLGGHQEQLDGQWINVCDDLQGGEVTISDGWIFRYRRLRDCDGHCITKKRTIEIKAGLDGDTLKGTLLHEMIHAYEGMLAPCFRDWLMLDLYARMARKIGVRPLRCYLDLNTHTLLVRPWHGGLFLLKSLELDERLGWKRGTVFGYGREEHFSRRSEEKQTIPCP